MEVRKEDKVALRRQNLHFMEKDGSMGGSRAAMHDYDRRISLRRLIIYRQ